MNGRGWRVRPGRFAGVSVGLLWLLAAAAPAAAQAVSPLATSLDPQFQAVLTHPGSLADALRYAESASQTSDVESAIGTYEQLLFYNPTLSRMRFQLGELYYRLGSYAQARGYFKTALDMRDATPDLRQKAQEYIAEIDKKLSPDQFSGFAQTGLRYQTNASLGPGSQTLLASGRTFDNRFLAHPDWNWFGAFGVNYVHDLETQNGDIFEASVIGYDSQQFALHQFDVGLMELRAGPRFGILPDSLNGASIKPYVVATGGTLSDALYYGGIGGGLTARVKLGNVVFDPYLEIVQQGYRDLGFYPLAGGLSGTLQTYAVQAAGPLAPGLAWQSRVGYAHDDTAYGPYSYNAFFADVWLPWSFSPPWDRRTWIVTPTFGITDWAYRSADPNVDPTTAQRSLEWRVGLNVEAPIVDQIRLAVLVQYRAIASNLAIYSIQDLAVSAGPIIRF